MKQGQQTSRRKPFPLFERNTMILLIAWAAGSIDAISYVALGHVFVANMTGNTVLLGLAIGQGQGLAAVRSIVALAGFILGVSLGGAIVGRGQDQSEWPRAVSWAITLDGASLCAFAVLWYVHGSAPHGAVEYMLIALSALAMGTQSMAVRRLGVKGIATTYITGTLTSFVSGITRQLHTVIQAATSSSHTTAPKQGAEQSSSNTQQWREIGLQGAVLLIYGLGAVASAWVVSRALLLVPLLPLIAVALVIVNAFAHQNAKQGD